MPTPPWRKNPPVWRALSVRIRFTRRSSALVSADVRDERLRVLVEERGVEPRRNGEVDQPAQIVDDCARRQRIRAGSRSLHSRKSTTRKSSASYAKVTSPEQTRRIIGNSRLHAANLHHPTITEAFKPSSTLKWIDESVAFLQRNFSARDGFVQIDGERVAPLTRRRSPRGPRATPRRRSRRRCCH